ncbi:hypothetical protein EVAR_14182_1 [Eumeta japonica]|uniref:Endonuclease/exonuclease/phosphatase domain-containing protein n=1 Tax=Eumeta variegata TaxID=151549 RepID=A0A4C1UET1_EUMVA|nr:hypothetical protein EVAR_14182_1 [Eumeta japonica]
MAESPYLRIGQVNLGGSIVATQELPSVARGIGHGASAGAAVRQAELITDSTPVHSPLPGGPRRALRYPRPFVLLSVQRRNRQASGPPRYGPEHPSWEKDSHRGGLQRTLSLWFCERRQYIGRGPETEYRRQRMEGIILGRGLIIHNCEDQPCKFAGPSGESTIDLTLSIRNLRAAEWTVNDQASSSDHRLITYRWIGTELRAQSQFRIGRIPWGASAARVAKSFTDVVTDTARVSGRAKAEDIWRAENRNVKPSRLAYRAASGRCLAQRGVVNGLALAEGYACDTQGAMSGVLRALCPDDDSGRDTEYHNLVRVVAATTPSGVWKCGRLLVLPKGNGRAATDPKTYRPITLFSVLGKILERILLKLAVNITANLSTSQHGFTAGRSTRTALNSILGVARDSTEK